MSGVHTIIFAKSLQEAQYIMQSRGLSRTEVRYVSDENALMDLEAARYHAIVGSGFAEHPKYREIRAVAISRGFEVD